MRFLFAQTHAPASHHSSFCPQGCDYTNNNVNWYYDEATREIKIGDKCLDSDDELTGALQNDDAKVVVNGENWAKKPVSTQNNVIASTKLTPLIPHLPTRLQWRAVSTMVLRAPFESLETSLQ